MLAILNRLVQKLQSSSTQDIQRAIGIMFAALVVSLASFGGYYYWDRYVHLDDKSPLERDIERVEQAIHQDPHDPESRVALAKNYLSKRMYKKALDQTSQVLSLYPEHEGALLISGITHVRLNQPQAALDPLGRFIKLRKERPMAGTDTALEAACYYMGESYMKLNRPGEAIPALQAALLISPTDADALYQLGLAHQASGQPRAALEQYHKAVRLVPNFSEAYTSMIDSYSALEYPDYVAYAQGMQALCLKDYETALTHLEHAAQALPDFAPVFLGLGLTYENMGKLQAAMTAMQRALELDSVGYAARYAHGRIQAALNSQDEQ